jgi:hypothetical protein
LRKGMAQIHHVPIHKLALASMFSCDEVAFLGTCGNILRNSNGSCVFCKWSNILGNLDSRVPCFDTRSL